VIRRKPRKTTEAERARRIDSMLAAGVEDTNLAAGWQVPRKAKKVVAPKPPEITTGTRCILVLDQFVGSLERRDHSRLNDLQAQLLEGWGLVVELADNWQEKWPNAAVERGDD
jgi:hypothetical protein